MSWYIDDLARRKREREGLETSAIDAEWLTIVGWRVDDQLRLVVDVDITVGQRTFPVYLRFPELFPDTAPSVFPRGEQPRWSGHQYSNGELCLEYAADNWTPDLTAVDVIKSAHKLLSNENPESGEAVVVPSRHQTSIGQDFRHLVFRVLVTEKLAAFLRSMPTSLLHTGTVLIGNQKKGNTYLINKIEPPHGDAWTDPDVPQTLVDEYINAPVRVFRMEEKVALPSTASLAGFRDECAALGLEVPDDPYLALVHGEDVHFYYVWKDDIHTVPVIQYKPFQPRLADGYETLKGKSVALVGCGSLGSKVAEVLARSGVGRFLLIDDDIFMPANVVRNALDWRDVGAHKADALSRTINVINPAAQRRAWRAQIGGQEANASAETLLSLVGDCDLIIDATADPNALNLLSAVVNTKSKPLVWGEVFAGGIGGLVARCRPGLEPAPQYMRRAIENWFGERNAPPARANRGYGADVGGQPLVADDGDVTVIAGHLSRLALDLLLGRDPSLFPHSVYAIGMGAGTVFSQPFEVFPIGMPPPPEKPAVQSLSEEETKAEVIKIVELLMASKK